ncbi:hypothetical protein Patl1_10351 [Pistacia atlantica]|uniref:Uncharacterized protein n=1 Tax=Pistacia atlantica TaxID=434234 RepID=A0ACC1A704_9ROSI|nr:hypothetical protein Patl1_10351 [Pistacia atlantica]
MKLDGDIGSKKRLKERFQEEAQPQTFLQIKRGLDLPPHLHMISKLFNSECIRNLTSMEDICPLNSETISLNTSGSYSVYIMVLEFYVR